MAHGADLNRPFADIHHFTVVNQPEKSLTARPKSRWKRPTLLAGAVLLTVLAALHVPLLRALGEYLIVDQPPELGSRVVLLPDMLSEQAALEKTAQLYREHQAAGVLLCVPRPSRAAAVGAWPAEERRILDDLTALGVPPAAIENLPGRCATTWDAARGLDRWLAEHKDQRLIVLCETFHGRHERRVLALVMEPPAMAAVHFAALPGSASAADWWHSREGFQAVFQEYARWTFLVLQGESAPCVKSWSYDDLLKGLPPAEARQ